MVKDLLSILALTVVFHLVFVTLSQHIQRIFAKNYKNLRLH